MALGLPVIKNSEELFAERESVNTINDKHGGMGRKAVATRSPRRRS
jgi:hypothetical protein